jgi:hypothetical protein
MATWLRLLDDEEARNDAAAVPFASKPDADTSDDKFT